MGKIKYIKFLPIILLLVFTYGCKDDLDEQFDRPDWLQPTIYKTLEQNEQFSMIATCIKKSQYYNGLNKTGYYTFFAPNNKAFNEYLQKKGLSSVNQVSKALADSIVSFLSVYSAYTKNKIDDYQFVNTEPQIFEDIAFRRRTYFTRGFYEEENNPKIFIDQNAVDEDGEAWLWFERGNYKHISYFTDDFFAANNVKTSDYEAFFPNATLSDFNVVDAQVYQADVICENGVIHYIDKVIEPLPSLLDILKSDEQYSEFYGIIKKFFEIPYHDSQLDEIYYRLTGVNREVWVNIFPGLFSAPNVENFRFDDLYDSQFNGFTMFAPTNDAVKAFMDTLFLEYYDSLAVMNIDDVEDFINVHCFQSMVWPSLLSVSRNELGVKPDFDMEKEIIDMQFASNGLFYGVKKVIDADIYNSLWRELLLNPDYFYMKKAIETAGIESEIASERQFTIFMLNNEAFEDLGFSIVNGNWELDNPELGDDASNAVKRLLGLHLIPDVVIEDFNGKSLIETYNQEYIKAKTAGSLAWVYSAGNTISQPKIESPTFASNGVGYTFSKSVAILYSNQNVGQELKNKFGASKFYQYLDWSYQSKPGYVYNEETFAVSNIKTGVSYTILVPSDLAMQAAVDSGLIPEITATYFTDEENDQVFNFVMYHIIKTAIIGPGTVNNTIDRNTLYKNLDGDVSVTVADLGYNVYFTDQMGRQTRIDSANVNLNTLSNYAIIQPIQGFLDYRIQE